jgi:hypothetical protein
VQHVPIDRSASEELTKKWRQNQDRLLSFVSTDLDNPSRTVRRAKALLAQGAGHHNRLSLSMQQQQRQQQQHNVTTRRRRPPKLKQTVTAPPSTLVTTDIPITDLITAANIEEKLGAFWSTCDNPTSMSLTDCWARLCGYKTAPLATHAFKTPIIQAVDLETMKHILKHFSYFMGGVVAHNLPENFYWAQHQAQQRWVLFFDEVRGNSLREAAANPLTLHITTPHSRQRLTPPQLHTLFKGVDKAQTRTKPSPTEAEILNQYETLFTSERPSQDKLNALQRLMKTFTILGSERFEPVCQAHLLKLFEIIDLTHPYSNTLIEGLGQLLCAHGLIGLTIILERFEKLIEMDRLLPFLNYYLKTATDFAPLLESDSITALDYLCQANENQAQFFWQLIVAQSQEGHTIPQTTNLQGDVTAFQYFIAEVQHQLEHAPLKLPQIKEIVPNQPIQVSLDRALTLIKLSLDPLEQIQSLEHCHFGSTFAYYAVKEYGYHIISKEMEFSSVYLDDDPDQLRWLQNTSDFKQVLASCEDENFEPHIARHMGYQTDRSETIEKCLKIHLRVMKWGRRVGLDTRLINIITLFILHTTCHHRASFAIDDIDNSISHFIELLSSIGRNDLRVFYRFVYCLPASALEQYALTNKLVLSDVISTLSPFNELQLFNVDSLDLWLEFSTNYIDDYPSLMQVLLRRLIWESNREDNQNELLSNCIKKIEYIRRSNSNVPTEIRVNLIKLMLNGLTFNDTGNAHELVMGIFNNLLSAVEPYSEKLKLQQIIASVLSSCATIQLTNRDSLLSNDNIKQIGLHIREHLSTIQLATIDPKKCAADCMKRIIADWEERYPLIEFAKDESSSIDALSVHARMKDEFKLTEQRFKGNQSSMRHARGTLPFASDIRLKKLSRNLKPKKDAGYFEEKILTFLGQNISAYIAPLNKIATEFSEKPYDLRALTPQLNILGKLFSDQISSIRNAVIIANHTVIWTMSSKINESIHPALFSEKNRPNAPSFAPVVRELISWLIVLPDENVNEIITPLFDSIFKLMQWFEKVDSFFKMDTLDEALQHLETLVDNLQKLMNHPMKGKSILQWLKQLQPLLKDSYFEHTIELIIQCASRRELFPIIKPFLESYWHLSQHTLQKDKHLEGFYERLTVLEREALDGYQRMLKILHIPAVILELHQYNNYRMLEALKKKPVAPRVAISEQEALRKKEADAVREWWMSPTNSITILYEPQVRYWLKHQLNVLIQRLNLPAKVAEVYFTQVNLHFLGVMNASLPLGESLKVYQAKQDQLIDLNTQLTHFLEKFKQAKCNRLIGLITQYYRLGVPVEIISNFMVLLIESPLDDPIPLAEKLLESAILRNIKDINTQLEQAIEATRQSYKAEVTALSNEEKLNLHFNTFIQHLTQHNCIPSEKLKQWRALTTIDQTQLERFVNAVTNATLDKKIEPALTAQLFECLDAHIETSADVFPCLELMLRTPELHKLLSRFPEDREHSKFWLTVIHAFSEAEPTPEEWQILQAYLQDNDWATIQPILQTYLYPPYPHKMRLLALMQCDDEAERDKQLKLINQHPVWASKSPDDAPTPPIIHWDDDHRVMSVIDELRSPMAGELIQSTFKSRLAKSTNDILGLIKTYGTTLSKIELIERQRLVSEAIRQKVEPIRKNQLEWLALSSVLLYQSTGIYPNTTQLTTIILSFSEPNNLLLQMSTGEGKSYVTALLAAYKWLEVGSVDVMSSNAGLVNQDYIDKGIWRFFKMLGIPSRMLFANATSQYKLGYVNYTTPWDRSFIQSAMFVNTLQRETPGKIACIADECDWLLLKMIGITFDFVHTTGKANELEWIYPHILTFVESAGFKNSNRHDRNTWSPKRDIVELKKFMGTRSLTVEESQQWADISQYEGRLTAWINAACWASTLKNGVNYLIMPDSQDTAMYQAVPLVQDIPQVGAQYSNGVQCFLIAKLRRDNRDMLFSMPEEVRCIDTNYPLGLLHMYHHFTGLTGTLGSQSDLLYLMTQLHTRSYIIPTHEPNLRENLPLKLCANEADHLSAITQQIQSTASTTEGAMPTLIIEEDVIEVMNLQAILMADQRLVGYTIQTLTGDESREILAERREQATKPNTITICTTLFSRGIDLKPLHQKGLLVIMACLKELATQEQAFGRSGRYGANGIAVMILNAARYGLEQSLICSQQEQESLISALQNRVSIELAVERYYTQKAAEIRQSALSLFDDTLVFWSNQAIPDRRASVNHQLLVFREEWIQTMVMVWHDALDALDPDNQFSNLYIRRQPDGGLDLKPIEAIKDAYAEQLNIAWQSLRGRIMNALQDFLNPETTHAQYQKKWLMEQRSMTETIRHHQQQKQKAPAGWRAFHSDKPWVWKPLLMASKSSLAKTKQASLDSLSLDEFLQLNEQIKHATLSQFEPLNEQALQWLHAYQSRATNLMSNECVLLATQIHKLQEFTLTKKMHWMANQIQLTCNWANKNDRSFWRYWFSRPSIRLAATEIWAAANEVLSRESLDSFAETQHLLATLEKHQKILSNVRKFPWNKALFDTISEAITLLKRHAPQHDPFKPAHTTKTGTPENSKINTQFYRLHTGFDSREVSEPIPIAVDVSTLALEALPLPSERLAFFKSWLAENQKEAQALDSQIRALKEIETKPYPWTVTNIPPEMQSHLQTLADSLPHFKNSPLAIAQVLKFDTKALKDALTKYRQLIETTWENIGQSKHDAFDIIKKQALDHKAALRKIDEMIIDTQNNIADLKKNIDDGEQALSAIKPPPTSNFAVKLYHSVIPSAREKELQSSIGKYNKDKSVLETKMRDLADERAIIIDKLKILSEDFTHVYHEQLTPHREILDALLEEDRLSRIQACRENAKTIRLELEKQLETLKSNHEEIEQTAKKSIATKPD